MGFEINKTYQVKPVDHTYPVLDNNGNDTGEQETIISPVVRFKVVSCIEEPKGFIEVHDLDKNINHLFCVSEAESAELIVE
jgi:hypothetical protein